MGDVILVTPLLRALRARHPDAFIAVATKRPFAPLLEHNPRIDRLHVLGDDSSLANYAAGLRAERFTHLLDLHGSLRSRMLRALVPGRWSGYPKYRIARALLIRTKHDRYRAHVHVAERYFAAAEDLDVRPDGLPPEVIPGPTAQAQADAWLHRHGLSDRPAAFAIAPGAAHATKRWPVEHWRALVRALLIDGHRVVILGGPADVPLARAVADGFSRQIVSAAGQFGLLGTAALLARCRGLVSGDTGVMHLATAVGTPVVALFGPTVEQFGFYPYKGDAIVLERRLDCRPCSSHGGPTCPLGHHRCMVEIGPVEVETVLRPLAR